MSRIAHDVAHCHRLEHHHFGLDLVRDLQLRTVSTVRDGAVDLAGGVDRRHDEPAHELTGQRLERDHAAKARVEWLHRADHLERGQSRRGLGQLVPTWSTELRGPEFRQRSDFGVIRQRTQVETAGDDRVLHVVDRVGHIVGEVHDLCLQRPGVAGGALPDPLQDLGVLGVGPELAGALAGQPRVLGGRVQGGTGEVEAHSPALRVDHLRFQPGQDADGLRIALVAAAAARHLVQCAFTVVSVRRMADVVAQAGQVRQVLVAAQAGGDTARDLRDLERMGEAGPRGVPVTGSHDLGLVRQTSQGGRVQYPRAITLERTAFARRRPRPSGVLVDTALAVRLVVGVTRHGRLS